MVSAFGTGDQCNSVDTQQGSDEQKIASRPVIEKVMAKDDTVDGGKSIVRSELYANCSCQNNVSCFFGTDITSYSLLLWKNVSFTVQAESAVAKNNDVS